jgi:hypothetical protein
MPTKELYCQMRARRLRISPRFRLCSHLVKAAGGGSDLMEGTAIWR